MGSFGQHNDRSVTTARRLRRLGIALLCETLRERLRSVTRDWGLGIGDYDK
ncbi:MAG: hypothetical protein HEQ35_08225 [Gloeotrichia echinulata IR180]|nr:hypothetical protein [Gloeotrichia echinulata DEX184]